MDGGKCWALVAGGGGFGMACASNAQDLRVGQTPAKVAYHRRGKSRAARRLSDRAGSFPVRCRDAGDEPVGSTPATIPDHFVVWYFDGWARKAC